MRPLLLFCATVLLMVLSTVPGATSVLLLIAGIAFLLRSSRRPAAPAPDTWPSVSVIIPARNEERDIEAAVQSLSQVDYPDLEVIVVNDCSTDHTAQVAQQAIDTYAGDRNFRLLESPAAPPEGWVGKTFATDYAITMSSGDTILVCDADILHTPQSLKTAVSVMCRSNASLLARAPFLEVHSALEYPLLLLVFVIKFGSFVARALGSRQSFAMGTYLLFTRAFYEKSGGWQTHRSFPESLPLANYALAHGEPFVFMDDDYKEITTRMYRGGRATARGMLRNIHFSLLQPLPLAVAFFFLAASINALLEIGFGFPEGWLLLCVTAGLFGVTLARSRYHTATVTGTTVLFPLLLVGLCGIACAAALRQWIPISVGWRDRGMYVQ